MSEVGGKPSPMSGLTPADAQAIHKLVVQYTGIYVAIALVAHLLMWIYRPWFM